MNLTDYVIDHRGYEWSKLLEEWKWLLPPQYTVWILTRAGDLFITTPDGAVHMLDVGAGELKQVAGSLDEARTKFADQETAEDWLMVPIVDQMVAAQKWLALNQCYGFKVPPVMGGAYDISNRVVIGIAEHLGLAGSIYGQMAGLPPGTKVEFKVK